MGTTIGPGDADFDELSSLITWVPAYEGTARLTEGRLIASNSPEEREKVRAWLNTHSERGEKVLNTLICTNDFTQFCDCHGFGWQDGFGGD